MGGLSMSMYNPYHGNITNPAVIAKVKFSLFETALDFETRQLRSNSSDQSELKYNGGLNYLTFTYPVINSRWGLSFGLTPYSNVNYNLNDTQSLPNEDIVNYIYSGDGGITQAYLSNGVSYKNFSLGLKISYLFGVISNTTSITTGTGPTLSQYISEFSEQRRFGDFSFTSGMHYDAKLGENYNVNFGAIYEFASNISGASTQIFSQKNYSGNSINADTVFSETGSIVLPSGFGAGLSLSKNMTWKVGVDYRIKNWSSYRNFDGSNQSFNDFWTIRVGGAITPDPTSVKNYLERITYRIGFQYEKTPYFINLTAINNFGINFGISLPIASYSKLNFAFELGRRGTTNAGLIQEDYFRIYFGASINEFWFRKRKFD